eukprot:10622102-Lingulodinium_polyedra.AAC.2
MPCRDVGPVVERECALGLPSVRAPSWASKAVRDDRRPTVATSAVPGPGLARGNHGKHCGPCHP